MRFTGLATVASCWGPIGPAAMSGLFVSLMVQLLGGGAAFMVLSPTDPARKSLLERRLRHCAAVALGLLAFGIIWFVAALATKSIE